MSTTPFAKMPAALDPPAAPPLAPMDVQSPHPALPYMATPNPLQQNITADSAQLQKVRMDKARPWGFAGAPPSAEFPQGLEPNHPGKLGKLAHVFATLGNIAGDIVAPSTMMNIPGTQMNRDAQEGQLVKRLNSEQTQQTENTEREAATGKTKSDTAKIDQEIAAEPGKEADAKAMQAAQIGHLNSQSDALRRPKPENPNQGYAAAIADAMQRNVDPANDPHVMAWKTAIDDIAKQDGEKLQYQTTLGPDGKPHVYALDGKGAKVADEGVHYEKPSVVNVNAGRAEDRRAKGDTLKAYQPTLDSAERMNVMTENYEKAIKDHDQQAMLSLLANHLGMTMGLQKGARLTKDIIQEAQHSAPWLQGLQAKFDKDGYLSGVNLTPGQMRQMVGLGQSRYAEDAKKSRSMAQYMGATDDGPERITGPATMRYYLGLTNGDPAKAKAMAAGDGWTVK